MKLVTKIKDLYKDNKIFRTGVHIGLLVIALLIGLAIGGLFNKDGRTKIADAAKYAEDQDYSEIEESDSISIPGYDILTFAADKKEQEVQLHNPQDNTCYFKMSLILSDGTCIWTSDLLEPGKGFEKITLDKTLKAGTYSDVTLKYECYSLKDQTQLNGAEIKLTIEVQ